MSYTADNIEITIATGTAILATDYGTSGSIGFSASHAQVAKIAWGDENNTYRTSEAYPIPMKIYGITGTTIPISGSISGTGDFYVRTNPTIPLIIKGSTFTTDAAVGITGFVQGMTNGIRVGVTGSVSILGNVGVFGVSGATAIAVTGGRRSNYSTDSVTVYGNVGISGGFQLVAIDDSVSVYGPGGSTYVSANIFSNGNAVGMSGDALKVAVTNTGFTFSVSVAATVGVTNGSEGALRVQGYTGTGTPITIMGSLAGGAVEIGAYTPVPVGVSGTVSIDDTDLISTIESLKTNISTVATNAGYALDILNLINNNGSGAKVSIESFKRPNRFVHGQKTVNSTPSAISTEALKSGITLKSPTTNTVDIFIGNSISVSTSSGYILSPGESIFLELSTVGSIFVRTQGVSANLVYIGS